MIKKMLYAISVICCISLSFSEYHVKVPLEQNRGGSLPNNSIKLGGGGGSGHPQANPEQICSEKESQVRAILTSHNSTFFGIYYVSRCMVDASRPTAGWAAIDAELEAINVYVAK